MHGPFRNIAPPPLGSTPLRGYWLHAMRTSGIRLKYCGVAVSVSHVNMTSSRISLPNGNCQRRNGTNTD